MFKVLIYIVMKYNASKHDYYPQTRQKNKENSSSFYIPKHLLVLVYGYTNYILSIIHRSMNSQTAKFASLESNAQHILNQSNFSYSQITNKYLIMSCGRHVENMLVLTNASHLYSCYLLNVDDLMLLL